MCGGCSLTSAELWRAGHVPVRDLLSPESRVTSLHEEQNIQHWQQQWQLQAQVSHCEVLRDVMLLLLYVAL